MGSLLAIIVGTAKKKKHRKLNQNKSTGIISAIIQLTINDNIKRSRTNSTERPVLPKMYLLIS